MEPSGRGLDLLQDIDIRYYIINQLFPVPGYFFSRFLVESAGTSIAPTLSFLVYISSGFGLRPKTALFLAVSAAPKFSDSSRSLHDPAKRRRRRVVAAGLGL